MLRRRNDDEWEIDRKITWQLAIESNMELQEKVFELEEEIKRLNNLVDKLHADCFYYENHREPKEKGESLECPF